MKKIFYVILITILLFPVNVFADVNQLISIQGEDREYAEKVIKLQYVSKEPEINRVKSFDISSDGQIALLTDRDGNGRQSILVYTSDFEFQFGLSFYVSGTSMFKWESNDSLLVYITKANAIFSISKNATVRNVFDSHDATRIFSKYTGSRTINYNGTEYELKGSKFTYKPENGEKITLHDAGISFADIFVLGFLTFWIITSAIIVVILYKKRKLN